MFGGNYLWQQSRYRKGIFPYMALESPGVTLYGHWAAPLVMEYHYRAREYCIIIFIKYLIYSDSLSFHQIEQLATSLKPMELSVKTQKLVIVFEHYNNNTKFSTMEIPDHDTNKTLF